MENNARGKKKVQTENHLQVVNYEYILQPAANYNDETRTIETSTKYLVPRVTRCIKIRDYIFQRYLHATPHVERVSNPVDRRETDGEFPKGLEVVLLLVDGCDTMCIQ